MSSPFIPALMIIGLGLVVRRLGLLGEHAGQTMSRVILNLTLPALVLTTMTRAQLPGAAFILPLVAITWCVLMLGVGNRFFSKMPKKTGGVMILSLMGFSIGQFAYPLVEAAWGVEALALLVMFDIGNALVIFSLGYILAGVWSGQPANPRAVIRRLVTFVPLLSYILALGLNIAGVKLPVLIDNPLQIVGAANQSMVLLLIGLYLNPAVILGQVKQVLTIVTIRYGLGLAAGLAVYFLLPVPNIIRSVLLVTFLLPVPMSVVPYSLEYGLDVDLAGALVNATIIISFGLMFLAFTFL